MKNCEYLLSLNFFTAYLLQKIGKLSESKNFIHISEKMLVKLLNQYSVKQSLIKVEETSLEMLGSHASPDSKA